MITNRQKTAGLILSGTFWLVTLLHIYWALGGTWAFQESIGEGNPKPPAWAIWLVSGGSVIAAIGVLGQIGMWGRWIPSVVFRVGVWILFGALVGVVVLNASTGNFWEVYVIAPLCAILAVLAFLVAKAKRDV